MITAIIVAAIIFSLAIVALTLGLCRTGADT